VNDVVVGVKEGLNEKIVLVLELDNTVQPGDLLSIKADIDAINAKLPNEKKVQESLIYKKTMPIANNMKVKRYVLRDALSSGHNDDFTTFEGPRRAISFVGYDPEEVKSIMGSVRSVFSKTLLLPEFKIADDAIWTTDLGGDSMSYVSMVSDLNDAFKLVIPTEEYGRLTCVKDFTLEILELRHSSSSHQK
jgi:acyl carrier protein